MLELEANIGLGKATNLSLPLFGSALGGIGVFTSLCVPSAFLADSSVIQSAGGSLKPPETAQQGLQTICLGHPAYLPRDLDWDLLGDDSV